MSEAGLVATVRGRGGGVQLTRDPTTITVGDVMRAMEDDFAVVECLGPARYCQVAGVCGARSVFARALSAYFGVLDGATLEDIAMNDQGLRGALGLTGKIRPVAAWRVSATRRAPMAIDFEMTPRQRKLKYDAREFAREVLRPVGGAGRRDRRPAGRPSSR